MEIIGGLLILLFLISMAIGFYFLPVIIAAARKTKNRGGIFAINLLFGWTVIGWIACAIWAAGEKTEG
jgi:hypothetical protein